MIIHEETVERLTKKWPDIFYKSAVDNAFIPTGWFHILDTLFMLLSQEVEDTRMLLSFSEQNPNSNVKTKSLQELEQDYRGALERLPKIEMLRRINANLFVSVLSTHPTEEMAAFLKFASKMAQTTCEECGEMGISHTFDDGSRYILCEHHKNEYKEHHDYGLFGLVK